VREFDGSFVRFVLVGLSNFVISFSVFRGLLALPWTFEFKATVSQIASYAAGTVWSFLWNRRFTFRSAGSIPRQAVRFFTLQAAMAGASAGLIGLFVDVMSLPATPTWLCVMGCVTIVNYLLCKRWVFR
jgi:putative flippase GtrA